jgi:hypothetical protein
MGLLSWRRMGKQEKGATMSTESSERARDTLIRVTSTLIVALAGVIGIAIVGGTAYFFARLLWKCRP